VKGYYRRPLFGQPLAAAGSPSSSPRPARVRCSPTSAGSSSRSRASTPVGEAARGRALVEGWGVEIGLLIDLADQFGMEVLAQADLVREHRNRLEPARRRRCRCCSLMRRAGVADDGRPRSCVRRAPRGGVDRSRTRERPPMLELPHCPVGNSPPDSELAAR
jgi:hypothetical protein